MQTKQSGFTLIELMIVVAIIGILASIAIPQYRLFVGKSQVTRVMEEASTLRIVLESCMHDGYTTIGTGAFECDPRATGSTLVTGASQGSVVLQPGTGVPQVVIAGGIVTITATMGNAAAADLVTKQVIWTRDIMTGWSCTSTVDPVYKPRGC